MDTLTFWKVVTMDASQLLERLLALLDAHGIRYRVIGGQAVNAVDYAFTSPIERLASPG